MADNPKLIWYPAPFDEAVGVPLKIRGEDRAVVFRDFIVRFSTSDFEQLSTIDLVGKRVSILKTDLPSRPIIVRVHDAPSDSPGSLRVYQNEQWRVS
jgi:hypothetical protein